MAGMDVFKSTPAKVAYGVIGGGALVWGGNELVKASQAPAQALEQQKQIQDNVNATLQALTPTATPTNTETPPSPTLPAATPTSMLGDWLGGGTPTQGVQESATPTNTVVTPVESATPIAAAGTPIAATETPAGALNTPGATIETATPRPESEQPRTAEEMAAMCGGDASQWTANPDWDGTKALKDSHYGGPDYFHTEWRPTNPDNLPFDWPRTPEEAAEFFFPGQNIDPKFMQASWTNPQTGLVEGWHLSEDHWLFGSAADVKLNIHPCEVAEGYTVNGTDKPEDNRNWIAFGGEQDSFLGGKVITAVKGQGVTIWMPGTDPNKIALEMEPWAGDETPHYLGPNGQQLGPDAIGFTPVYPAASVHP